LQEFQISPVAAYFKSSSVTGIRRSLAASASSKEAEADTIEFLYPVECDSMVFENATAFNVQDFEVGTDIDGHLVMRLIHTEKGVRHQKTYALDCEQGLRFISAFVLAAEQAEKFRGSPDTRQRFN
jgi:hypothetical protein